VFKQFFFGAYLDEEEAEKIIFVAHRHIFVIFKIMAINFILGVLIPIFVFLYIAPNFIWIFILSFFMFLKFLRDFLDWYYDVMLVTNIAVINIEWNGLFDRSSLKLEYDSIEGVSVKKSSFLAVVFGFGDLTIETIGDSKFFLDKVSRVRHVEEFILHSKRKYTEEKEMQEEGTIKNILSKIVAAHIKKYGINTEDDY